MQFTAFCPFFKGYKVYPLRIHLREQIVENKSVALSNLQGHNLSETQ